MFLSNSTTYMYMGAILITWLINNILDPDPINIVYVKEDFAEE